MKNWKSGKVELSDDMLDAVVGGSAWDWIQKTAHEITEELKHSSWR